MPQTQAVGDHGDELGYTVSNIKGKPTNSECDIVERVRARVGDSAKDILQKFLKVNKKHVSEKYHALVDSIPNNAYSLAKNDILDDVRKNLAVKNQVQNTHKTSGWQLHNGEIMGYKF